MAKKKQLKKKKFIDMEITRVPMNPEQAVLTCCDHVGRVMVKIGQCVTNPADDCAVGGSVIGVSS